MILQLQSTTFCEYMENNTHAPVTIETRVKWRMCVLLTIISLAPIFMCRTSIYAEGQTVIEVRIAFFIKGYVLCRHVCSA